MAGKRILLAEDAEDLQRLIAGTLAAGGADVTCARNGLEALAAAAKARFDAVLLDVQMPRMDGVEAARRLRAAGCRAPILALTAQSPLTMAPDIVGAFTGIITKPVPLRGLSKRVAAAIPGVAGVREGYEGS